MKQMYFSFGLLLGLLASLPTIAEPIEDQPMKIRMQLNGQVVLATLYDNPAARDFAAQLPLSLTLENYAVIERIADLPGRLSTIDAPAGMTPVPGDITYYAPWGNLAIFIAPRAYAQSLLPLGRVDSGLEALKRNGPLRVTIEPAQD
ncbi:cyclophilin-like fold protein [Pseudomonas capsici]|uniref:cyclophilin-like fold protein n=1 Tax=Pseudomonas capsici TaxID=2810614 RepID=UPI0021F0D576|nr:cyclophilin-like fold protein [Pseudomonas capsici]MCV4343769.1 cyclophilin-like fold protein [Pseudomonas capsici]